MSERLSVLIPADMMKEIDEFQKVTNLDKSTLIRQLLKKSIREMKIEYALKAYTEEKVSFGKAAEISGLNIWDSSMKHTGVKLNLSSQLRMQNANYGEDAMNRNK